MLQEHLFNGLLPPLAERVVPVVDPPKVLGRLAAIPVLLLELGVVGFESDKVFLQRKQLGRPPISTALADLAGSASMDTPNRVVDLSDVTATAEIVNKDQIVP